MDAFYVENTFHILFSISFFSVEVGIDFSIMAKSNFKVIRSVSIKVNYRVIYNQVSILLSTSDRLQLQGQGQRQAQGRLQTTSMIMWDTNIQLCVLNGAVMLTESKWLLWYNKNTERQDCFSSVTLHHIYVVRIFM